MDKPMNKHPFRRELTSKPAPGNPDLHVVAWIATVAVDRPRFRIEIQDGTESEAMVTVGSIGLPFHTPVWVDRAGTVAPVVPIQPGQLIEITLSKPFTGVLEGTCASLPGTLPVGTWVSFPNRAVMRAQGYFRVRRVIGLAPGETQVVAPDGAVLDVGPQGALATSILLAPVNMMRRASTPSDTVEALPLTVVGDLILPAHTVASQSVWWPTDDFGDASVIVVDATGSETTYIGEQAVAAVQAATA